MPPRVFEPEEKESISQPISLGQGELKLSNGEKRKVDAQTFSSYLNALSDSEIFALYNSADIVFSPDLDAILSQKAEGLIPGLMTGTDRGSITRRPSSFKALGEDYGRVSRGLIGNVGSAITSGIESAFVGPAERQVVESEYDSPLYGGGMKGFGRSILAGGRSPGDVDNILKSISTPTDSIGEDLTILENTPTAVKAAAEEVATEEAAVEEAPVVEAVAEEAVVEETKAEEVVTEEPLTETKPEVVPAGDFQKAGNIFSSPNFIRFAANLSKGLATSEDMASGLAKGAALAAEERGLRDLEQQKLDQEIELEFIKKFGDDAMKPTDAAKIRDTNKELTEQIKLFQKSQNNVKQVDEVISIIESGGATGLSGLAGKLITEAATALGKGPKDWANVDARSRADAILKVLQQENIREILGESGRTISNLDREVIKDVFGNITFRTSPAEILKKLRDSREKTLKSANQTKGDIAASLDFFNLTRRPSVVARQNADLLKIIMSFSPENYSSDYADQVIDVDFRSQFNK